MFADFSHLRSELWIDPSFLATLDITQYTWPEKVNIAARRQSSGSRQLLLMDASSPEPGSPISTATFLSVVDVGGTGGEVGL